MEYVTSQQAASIQFEYTNFKTFVFDIEQLAMHFHFYTETGFYTAKNLFRLAYCKTLRHRRKCESKYSCQCTPQWTAEHQLNQSTFTFTPCIKFQIFFQNWSWLVGNSFKCSVTICQEEIRRYTDQFALRCLLSLVKI